jgi:hypothetical protein
LLGSREHSRTKVEWSTSSWESQTWSNVKHFVDGYINEQPLSINDRGCILHLRSGMQLGCYENSNMATVKGNTVLIPHGNSIEVFRAGPTTRVAGAPGRIIRVTTNPMGTQIVGVMRNGWLAMWELGSTGVAHKTLFATTAQVTDHAILLAVDGRLLQIDRSGKQADLGETTLHHEHWLVPVGNDVISFAGSGRIDHFPHGSPPTRVEDAATHFARAGNQVIYAVGDRVSAYDLASRGTHMLVERPAGVHYLSGAADGAMAVAWNDRHVWWQTGGQIRETTLPCVPRQLIHAGDGIDFACDKTLHRLDATGTREVVTLPDPIFEWRRSGDRFVISSDRGAVWRVDRGVSTKLLAETENRKLALAADRIATVDAASGSVYVHDVVTGARAWIAYLSETPRDLRISTDGRSVVATAERSVIWWQDPTPTSPADWPAWRRARTPATLSEPGAALQWP